MNRRRLGEAAIAVAVVAAFAGIMVIGFARGHQPANTSASTSRSLVTGAPATDPTPLVTAEGTPPESQDTTPQPTTTALPTSAPESARPTPHATPVATPAPTPQGPRACGPGDWLQGPMPSLHATPGQTFDFQTSFEFGPTANACVVPVSSGRAVLLDSGQQPVSWCPEQSQQYVPQTAPPSPDMSGGIGPPIELKCDWPAGVTGSFTVVMTLSTPSVTLLTYRAPVTAS